MRYKEIISEATSPAEITRWVDAKGARNYLRLNAMVGRVRHWLPKQLTGLDKIYHKTGLSFGIPNSGSFWNAHGQDGICFVVDRNSLPNLVCSINGQAVYEFSDYYQLRVHGLRADEDHLRTRAIEDSKTQPDEAFVIGDIRNLAHYLLRIEVRATVDDRTRKLITQYGYENNIDIVEDK